MIESIEGEIIFRIHKSTGKMPDEIIKNRYTPNYRMLWRMYFIEIKRELEKKKALFSLFGAIF